MKSKVLLIDDSVTIHRVIDLSIDVDRYDIVKVFSKEDAALKMQSEQYDYILLDNKLDNIIISEYIKELKGAQPSASIILLVGAFDRFDESDLEKTGADDYLVKPFDSQSLNEKLSSDADMMPAGIVEKIAEADFARDNDDYVAPAATLVTGEAIDGLSKKEYLENLEEVQPDDLTDNGYAEDLDTAASLEFDKLPKEAEEELQQEGNTNTAIAEENNIIEESPEEDVIVEENSNEIEAVEDVMPENQVTEQPLFNEPSLDEPSLDEPSLDEANAGINTEQDKEPVMEISPVMQEENNENEVISVEENTENIELSSPAAEDMGSAEMPMDSAVAEDINDNAQINPDEIEIPDNLTAVHNPVLPDIADAAEISDEYIIHDNLAEVNKPSEMLNEFPDFPDIDDISTDEMQDKAETETLDNLNQEEDENNIENTAPVIEEQYTEDNMIAESDSNDISEAEQTALAASEEKEEKEDLLVDDDNWLSDAPVQQTEENISMPADEMTAEESSSELSTEDMFNESPAVMQEETPEDTGFSFEENVQPEDNVAENNSFMQAAEVSTDEFPAQVEESNNELFKSSSNDAGLTEEMSEIPVIDEPDTSLTAEQVSVDGESAEYTEENVEPEETFEQLNEENEAVENISLSEENDEILPVEEQTEEKVDEEIVKENILPVMQEEIRQEPVNIKQAEVKQAETYSPETSARFGGITVTISRDEIIAMLGNAIDKHFLEEAVKEVIAANMKDIVRNIVPAIAEKYIKEEIERLKNDE